MEEKIKGGMAKWLKKDNLLILLLAGVLLVLLEPPHAVRDAVIARASPNANTFFMDILLLHFVSYKSTGR